MRAAVHSLSDRLSQATTRLDAGVAELSAACMEFKSFKAESHKQNIVSDVSSAVSGLFAKHPKAEEVAVLFGKEVSKELDEKLAKLAQLDAELLKKANEATAAADENRKALSAWVGSIETIADSLAELKSSVREGREQMMGVSGQVDKQIDSKLSKLAKLEAELLKKEGENSQALAEIRGYLGKFELGQNREELIVNALGNLSTEIKSLEKNVREQVAQRQQAGFSKFDAMSLELKATQGRLEDVTSALKGMAGKSDENHESMHSALHKIIDNQNAVNSVLSEALTALLDSTESLKNSTDELKMHVTQIKSKMEGQLNPDQIERKVEEKLARKLAEE